MLDVLQKVFKLLQGLNVCDVEGFSCPFGVVEIVVYENPFSVRDEDGRGWFVFIEIVDAHF